MDARGKIGLASIAGAAVAVNYRERGDAVILNLGDGPLGQHEGGLASLEELLPLFGQDHSLFRSPSYLPLRHSFSDR
ncbi:hypothetical protein [Rhizobium mayense]|uniref:Uncharacterized protein n=1 Tax=Rhizobium mayense TaxID=1312184 RepID=A0ABT7JWC4_9HYPH|nr:hypothetical protein [Rhizobium mayense]MDL2400040.1 hypothetical protein [Rhizobium mayense]